MAEAESLETAAEHERILREIESTDTACIGPTLRYPGDPGHRWAGTGGTGAGPLRGRAPGRPLAGPAPAPPFGDPREPPPRSARRVSVHRPDVGSLLNRRRAQPSYSAASSCLRRAGAVLVLPPRLARSWATRARPAEGSPQRILPLGTSPFSGSDPILP